MKQAANPSIEGTSNIWLRQLSAAPHVKRYGAQCEAVLEVTLLRFVHQRSERRHRGNACVRVAQWSTCMHPTVNTSQARASAHAARSVAVFSQAYSRVGNGATSVRCGRFAPPCCAGQSVA